MVSLVRRPAAVLLCTRRLLSTTTTTTMSGNSDDQAATKRARVDQRQPAITFVTGTRLVNCLLSLDLFYFRRQRQKAGGGQGHPGREHQPALAEGRSYVGLLVKIVCQLVLVVPELQGEPTDISRDKCRQAAKIVRTLLPFIMWWNGNTANTATTAGQRAGARGGHVSVLQRAQGSARAVHVSPTSIATVHR